MDGGGHHGLAICLRDFGHQAEVQKCKLAGIWALCHQQQVTRVGVTVEEPCTPRMPLMNADVS